MTSSVSQGLTRFNSSDAASAAELLHEACASRTWGVALADGRPYADAEALYAASDAAMAKLSAEDLAEAMSGHPPIGRPKPGDPTRRSTTTSRTAPATQVTYLA